MRLINDKRWLYTSIRNQCQDTYLTFRQQTLIYHRILLKLWRSSVCGSSEEKSEIIHLIWYFYLCSVPLEVNCEINNAFWEWEKYQFDWNKNKCSNYLYLYISNNAKSLYKAFWSYQGNSDSFPVSKRFVKIEGRYVP